MVTVLCVSCGYSDTFSTGKISLSCINKTHAYNHTQQAFKMVENASPNGKQYLSDESTK